MFFKIETKLPAGIGEVRYVLPIDVVAVVAEVKERYPLPLVVATEAIAGAPAELVFVYAIWFGVVEVPPIYGDAITAVPKVSLIITLWACDAFAQSSIKAKA